MAFNFEDVLQRAFEEIEAEERNEPNFEPCDTYGKKCGHNWNSHVPHEYGGYWFYKCGLCNCSPSKQELLFPELYENGEYIGEKERPKAFFSTCRSCRAMFKGVYEEDIAQGIHRVAKCPICERAKGWDISEQFIDEVL